MGFIIERTYFSVMDAARENAQDGLSISGEFSRGLWSSSATAQIDWSGGGAVELEQVWIHGPVPLGEILRGRSPWAWVVAVVETHFGPDPEAWPEASFFPEEQGWVDGLVWLHFDRSVRFSFALPSMEMNAPPLASDGVWAEGTISSGADARIQSRVQFGRTRLGGARPVAFDGATLSLERSLDEQALTTLILSLDVGALDWAGQIFEKAELRAAFRRVDPSAALALDSALSALSDSEESQLSETEVMMARAQVLGEGLPQVFRGSPEIEISQFVLRSGEEAIEGQASMNVDGSDPSLLSNPLFLMGLMQAEAQISASRSLVEGGLDLYLANSMAQTEEAEGLSPADLAEMAAFMREAALGTWLASKRVVLEEDQFIVDLEFDGGLLILNGEMLDPTELSNPLSSMQ